MKSLRKIISLATLAFALGAAAPAHAWPDQQVDDLSLIGLSDAPALVERRFDYPGLGGAGGGFDNPDCLLLVTGARTHPSDDALEQLRNAIQVFDGDEILFPSSGARDLNLLPGRIVDERKLVFDVQDLGKFVTGLRITSRGDETIGSVVARLGISGPVALQVVRGCRLLGERSEA